MIDLAAFLLLGGAAGLAGFTRYKVRVIERRYPPVGRLVDIGGYRIHAVHRPRPDGADLPPLVFVHGASGNLRDQMAAFLPALEGRAEMLFIDRPGHGWSERGGRGNDTPAGQASALAHTMRAFGIERAILVGHSFGCAITASFALGYPGMTEGLLFLAPATHPWPGGVTWYYRIGASPFIGWAFSNTFVLPAGLAMIEAGTTSVFTPNPRPARYVEQTGPALVLRPRIFRANARDVAGLKAYVTRIAPRYREIEAPAVIITGDSDGVVLAGIHSAGLERDLPRSELVLVNNLGHKPDFVTTGLAIAAIEKLSGQPRDLQALAALEGERLKASIAGQTIGRGAAAAVSGR